MSQAFLRRSAFRCRDCRMQVVPTITKSGARQLVNLDQEVTATTAVRVDGAGAIRSRVLNDTWPLMPLETLHLPHAAVCKPKPKTYPVNRLVVKPAPADRGNVVDIGVARARRQQKNAGRQ